jgi:hypothetical protein
MPYRKETTRINVQFIDAKTDDLLFEIKDRNHLNVGEIMTDHYADMLMERELKGKRKPAKIMVIAVAEFSLIDKK